MMIHTSLKPKIKKITCCLGKETTSHLAILFFQVVVESDKVSCSPLVEDPRNESGGTSVVMVKLGVIFV